jgi:hypothetical protein
MANYKMTILELYEEILSLANTLEVKLRGLCLPRHTGYKLRERSYDAMGFQSLSIRRQDDVMR